MTSSRLTFLFVKYFDKTVTAAERDELMGLIRQAENEEELKLLLETRWQGFQSDKKVFDENAGEAMLVEIFEKDKINNQAPVIKIHSGSNTWIRVAAAAVVFFAVSVLFILTKPGAGKESQVGLKGYSAKINTIIPGGNKAVLTLSDGSSIVLDSTSQGTLATQGNAKVIQVNTGRLAYKNNSREDAPVVYNTLQTPRGGQYQLILPDGTMVWLNASSSINFPTVFRGKERNVTVTGEAYFEVAKSKSMPFNIQVKDMKVQVLGTHFNIMAYDDESTMNTTLLEGSVKVSKGSENKMLLPGQQSIISNAGEIKVVDANVEEVIAWKNGWFQFNAFDIQTVLRQVSRWYNVDIVYKGKMPSGHFSGIVSRSNNISQVLSILQGSGVNFRIEGRKVIVSS